MRRASGWTEGWILGISHRAVSHPLALSSCKPLSTPASISLGCRTHLNGWQPHDSVPTPAPHAEGGGGGGEEVTCGFPGQHLETLPQGHKASFPQGHRKPRPVPEGEERQALGGSSQHLALLRAGPGERPGALGLKRNVEPTSTGSPCPPGRAELPGEGLMGVGTWSWPLQDSSIISTAARPGR